MKKFSILVLIFAISVLLLYPKYYFLIWNVFLAYIPFWLSYHFNLKNKILRYVNMFLALIFYPNAVYLFTDLIHISVLKFYVRKNGHLEYIFKFENWLRVALIFIAVMLAMKLSYIAIHNYTKNFTLSKKYISYVIVSLLTGLAVYIGRFIRLNSWDLLLNPLKTTKIILSQITEQNMKFILLFAAIQLVVIIIEEKGSEI